MRDWRTTSRAKGLRNFASAVASMAVFGLGFLGLGTVAHFAFGLALTVEVVGWCLFAGALTERLLQEVL